MRWVALAAVAVLAGCLDIDETSYPLPVCADAYPDGSPKDCAKDESVPADAAAPAGVGWTCVVSHPVEHSGWRLRYELWRSSDGTWRAGVFGHGTRAADAVVATVALQDGAGRTVASRIVATQTDGWAPLGPAAGAAAWSVQAYAFDADAAVAVRATDWDGVTWFVYADPGGAWALDGNGLPGEPGRHDRPRDASFAVGGAIVTVDQAVIASEIGTLPALPALPGLGLPCDGPG